ncbi:hypothetical protein FHR20_001217 [Sphingomonas leidyi]|uniref:Plasmid segregation centromere-binding protein ParG n=1 Tax=Sphingomonas leidyi TaxID=68569 RepID=A0A7X5ZUP6_9SPHN|nr:hypothetical protein [Sphingomonas leidyi]NIJ64286.1 hypothetical protein [Sphingomonas leidyi]
MTRCGFLARPGSPDHWVAAPDPSPADDPRASAAFTARLTIDVTPDLRRRLKLAALTRGTTVADMLRELLAREFPDANGDAP